MQARNFYIVEFTNTSSAGRAARKITKILDLSAFNKNLIDSNPLSSLGTMNIQKWELFSGSPDIKNIFLTALHLDRKSHFLKLFLLFLTAVQIIHSISIRLDCHCSCIENRSSIRGYFRLGCKQVFIDAEYSDVGSICS